MIFFLLFDLMEFAIYIYFKIIFQDEVILNKFDYTLIVFRHNFLLADAKKDTVLYSKFDNPLCWDKLSYCPGLLLAIGFRGEE